ncbi:MAG: aspartate aminotransferase family protein [Calditrichaceae bacterium]
MFIKKSPPPSEDKKRAIENYREFVTSGKVAFFQKYGMDLVMGDREGPYISDMDGKKQLINLHCNGGVFNLGHRNAELIEVLKNGLDEYDIGNHHLMSKARGDLASMIAGLMPEDLDYTVFGVSGGEAIDLALKVARAFTGRPKIISALGGYHGHTGLALAAGDEKYRSPFGPMPPGFIQIPFGDITAFEQTADKETAAVILETIPATLGIAIPPEGYLKAIRKICTEKGILLIMDEVQTGLGRTGKLWGFEHFEIVPDIVVLGKGLSGGVYPISATVMRKPIESVFHKDPFIHISTFGGAEIGCLVAKKVLEISSSPEFLRHINDLALLFSKSVAELQKKYPHFIKGFRQLGLMMGLELRDDLSGPILTKTAYDNDLLMIYANNDTSVCQFLPPLVLEPEMVESITRRLDPAVDAARKLRPVLKIKKIITDILPI